MGAVVGFYHGGRRVNELASRKHPGDFCVFVPERLGH